MELYDVEKKGKNIPASRLPKSNDVTKSDLNLLLPYNQKGWMGYLQVGPVCVYRIERYNNAKAVGPNPPPRGLVVSINGTSDHKLLSERLGIKK